MTQTVTLELPEAIFLPAQRMAKAIQRPVTDLLVRALRAALPPLDELPPVLIANLVDLEKLDGRALRHVMLSQVPSGRQRKLNGLLEKNKIGGLTGAERIELEALQNEADRVMLRKARAAVLLRFRGQRLPTLVELKKLNQAKVR